MKSRCFLFYLRASVELLELACSWASASFKSFRSASPPVLPLSSDDDGDGTSSRVRSFSFLASTCQSVQSIH